MKNYNKPEIEIVEFDVEDVITVSGGPELKLEGDEVFFGDDQGYMVQQ